MILACGGLADPVTELVCARLEDRGYPYRLLDLGVYPVGFQVSWRWQDSYPTGYIASVDWRIDLPKLRGVYVRFLGSEEREKCRQFDVAFRVKGGCALRFHIWR